MNTQEFATKVLCENGAWLRDNAKSSEALKLYACIDALSAIVELQGERIKQLEERYVKVWEDEI